MISVLSTLLIVTVVAFIIYALKSNRDSRNTLAAGSAVEMVTHLFIWYTYSRKVVNIPMISEFGHGNAS